MMSDERVGLTRPEDGALCYVSLKYLNPYMHCEYNGIEQLLGYNIYYTTIFIVYVCKLLIALIIKNTVDVI